MLSRLVLALVAGSLVALACGDDGPADTCPLLTSETCSDAPAIPVCCGGFGAFPSTAFAGCRLGDETATSFLVGTEPAGYRLCDLDVCDDEDPCRPDTPACIALQEAVRAHGVCDLGPSSQGAPTRCGDVTDGPCVEWAECVNGICVACHDGEGNAVPCPSDEATTG